MLIRNFPELINNAQPWSKLDVRERIVEKIGATKQDEEPARPNEVPDTARKPAKSKPAFDVTPIVQILSLVRDIIAELRDIYRLFKNPPEAQQASP